MAVVEQGLVRTGVRVVKLGTEEVIELFYKLFNPGELEKPLQVTQLQSKTTMALLDFLKSKHGPGKRAPCAYFARADIQAGRAGAPGRYCALGA
jgi:hypothetical protein